MNNSQVYIDLHTNEVLALLSFSVNTSSILVAVRSLIKLISIVKMQIHIYMYMYVSVHDDQYFKTVFLFHLMHRSIIG